jgi:hypothetical protein
MKLLLQFVILDINLKIIDTTFCSGSCKMSYLSTEVRALINEINDDARVKLSLDTTNVMTKVVSNHSFMS